MQFFAFPSADITNMTRAQASRLRSIAPLTCLRLKIASNHKAASHQSQARQSGAEHQQG